MVTLLLLTGLFPVWFCFVAGVLGDVALAIWFSGKTD
ncbi:hypothetical protein TRN7648_00192 [Tropicibacter naphthalenivorans]|uniref:Uncharacterized protein n=1 Tax=Tropicibacter naphthalenivorans TaxID=441103 RepID=A0A0P1G008_9RHOB|nr:hypothetical protein TRN7648_00192 [Tropicibacter naphthalenivorans]